MENEVFLSDWVQCISRWPGPETFIEICFSGLIGSQGGIEMSNDDYFNN